MLVYIIEFWDCHYELIDSYITTLARCKEECEITIFALNIKLCEEQIMLREKYRNINVNVHPIQNIEKAKRPDLCIVNTTHIHGSIESKKYAMDLLEAIMPEKTIIACHNKYDVIFANEINLKNKRCFFLAEDCYNYYTSKNMLRGVKSFVYDAYADYSEIVGKIYRPEKSGNFNLAITGMIREGKKLNELYNLQEQIEEEKIKIHIYGSAHQTVLRKSGYYEASRRGYIDTSEVTTTRLNQYSFLCNVSKCDALLDLKIKTSEESRGSTSGNLQLSRSLNIPLITHTTSHPNFPTVNFLDYEHLRFILGNTEILSQLLKHTKNSLKLMVEEINRNKGYKDSW